MTSALTVTDADGRPIQTVGRRKEAIVRVRLLPGTGQFTLNGRTIEDYFPNKVHQQLIREPFVILDGTAVELELAGAGHEAHADDGLLATADGLDRTPVGVGHGQSAGHWATCLIS